MTRAVLASTKYKNSLHQGRTSLYAQSIEDRTLDMTEVMI
jgi:hypothetical protein